MEVQGQTKALLTYTLTTSLFAPLEEIHQHGGRTRRTGRQREAVHATHGTKGYAGSDGDGTLVGKVGFLGKYVDEEDMTTRIIDSHLFREAIQPDMALCRRLYKDYCAKVYVKESRQGKLARCQMTGRFITPRELTVDHVIPFILILRDWNQHKKSLARFPSFDVMMDAFVAFHHKKAKLQFMSHRANIDKGKGINPNMAEKVFRLDVTENGKALTVLSGF